MKKLFLCLSAIIMNFSVNAQEWSTSGSDILNTNIGNVGIGLTYPSAQKLHINGNLRIDGTKTLYFGTTNYLGVSPGGGFSLRMSDAGDGNFFSMLGTGASEVFRMTNTGFLGLGVTAPSEKLYIGSGNIGLDYNQGLRWKNSAGTVEFYQGNYGAGWATNGKAFYNSILVGDYCVSNAAGQLLVVKQSGKVGIGLSDPSEMLHAKTTANQGQMIIESSNNQAVRFTRTGVNNWIAGRRGNDNAFAITNSYVFDGTTDMFVINSAGNTGLGANTPDSRLHVKDGFIHIESGKLLSDGVTNAAPTLSFGKNPVNEYGQYAIEYLNPPAGTPAYDCTDPTKVQGLSFYAPWGSNGNGVNNVLFLSASGCVGIGTDLHTNIVGSTPNYYKLSVNGSVRATEIVVETGWADYVFAKDYKLKPLNEVEQYINENGTLPNIPSEKEMKEKQIGLGEQNKMQQEKIEELTLYIIEMNKKLNTQQEQNDALFERLSKVESVVGSK